MHSFYFYRFQLFGGNHYVVPSSVLHVIKVIDLLRWKRNLRNSQRQGCKLRLSMEPCLSFVGLDIALSKYITMIYFQDINLRFQ
jgi:hypothetical protein